MGEEDVLGDGAPVVTVDAPVDSDDTDTRIVGIVGAAVGLALSWVLLLSLRRMVASAAEGEPFDGRNVRRLQWIGGVLLAAPVLVYAWTRLVNATFDQRATMTVEVSAPSWWVFLLGGLGVLAARRGLPCRFRPAGPGAPHGLMPIHVHLDALLAERQMTLTELSEEVGITLANLSILKTGEDQGHPLLDARGAVRGVGLPAR